MINIWVFVVACVVFIGILAYEHFYNKKEIEELQEEYDNALMFLGYYSWKFGIVTNEQMANDEKAFLASRGVK